VSTACKFFFSSEKKNLQHVPRKKKFATDARNQKRATKNYATKKCKFLSRAFFCVSCVHYPKYGTYAFRKYVVINSWPTQKNAKKRAVFKKCKKRDFSWKRRGVWGTIFARFSKFARRIQSSQKRPAEPFFAQKQLFFKKTEKNAKNGPLNPPSFLINKIRDFFEIVKSLLSHRKKITHRFCPRKSFAFFDF